MHSEGLCTNSPQTLAVIIARGGSKGIPRKNLSLIGGLPMVQHTINCAKKALESVDMHIVLSSDSKEIINLGLSSGIYVPFVRPASLCLDNTPSLPVVQHAINEMESLTRVEYKYICYMQPTSPLCRPSDLISGLKLIQHSSSDSVVAITPVETHPFKMKRLLQDGRLVNYIDQGFEDMRPRQSLPPVYRRAGSFYISTRTTVMEHNTLVSDNCIGIPVPRDTAIDIDTYEDLELARICYNKGSI